MLIRHLYILNPVSLENTTPTTLQTRWHRYLLKYQIQILYLYLLKYRFCFLFVNLTIYRSFNRPRQIKTPLLMSEFTVLFANKSNLQSNIYVRFVYIFIWYFCLLVNIGFVLARIKYRQFTYVNININLWNYMSYNQTAPTL